MTSAIRLTEGTTCYGPDALATAHAPDAVENDYAHFVTLLFHLFDAHSVRYCVLHSFEAVFSDSTGDLDICIHRDDRHKFPEIIRELGAAGFQAIQCFHYSVGAFYFVFGWHGGLGIAFARLDVAFEHWRSGLSVPDIGETVASRQRRDGYWIAAPDAEFAYLLAKRTWKGGVSSPQAKRMQALAESLGRRKAEDIAGRVFPGKWKHSVVAACVDGNLAATINKARRVPLLTAIARHPLDLAGFVVRDVRRIARRVMKPTGLTIAVLGADGAGKSTLVRHMESRMRSAFRGVMKFHWAPRVIIPKRTANGTGHPHSNPVRGRFLSCCFLLGFVLDYWLGYVTSLWVRRRRSRLILFDRYFHDVLVDPRRYRYGGPQWFARWMTRLIPTPDLVVIPDADEDTIAARKGELSAAEVMDQQHKYKALRFRSALTLVVDSGRGEDYALEEVRHAIVAHLVRRFGKYYPEWTAAGKPRL